MKTLRESLTLLGLFGPVVFLCTVWSSLPATVPSHFGFNGVPNHFAPKPFLWLLPCIAALLYAMLLFLSRHPRWFNLPVPVGDPRRPRYEALTREMLAWLRLELVYVFAYIEWATIRTGLRQAVGLSPWLTPVPLIAILATVGFFRLEAGKQPQT